MGRDRERDTRSSHVRKGKKEDRTPELLATAAIRGIMRAGKGVCQKEDEEEVKESVALP